MLITSLAARRPHSWRIRTPAMPGRGADAILLLPRVTEDGEALGSGALATVRTPRPDPLSIVSVYTVPSPALVLGYRYAKLLHGHCASHTALAHAGLGSGSLEASED